MVGAKARKQKDVDHHDRQLYRQAFHAPNDVRGKIVCNIVQDQERAWACIKRIAERARLHSQRQTMLHNLDATKRVDALKTRTHYYIPKIMVETMWAATRGRTVVQYGMREHCTLHNATCDEAHITECELFRGVPNVWRHTQAIKDNNLRDWEPAQLLTAVAEYTSLALRVAAHRKEGYLVESRIHQSLPVSQPKRPISRPRGAKNKAILKNQPKISEYFMED